MRNSSEKFLFKNKKTEGEKRCENGFKELLAENFKFLANTDDSVDISDIII